MTRTGNVRVFLRVRPHEEGEKQEQEDPCISLNKDDKSVVVKDGDNAHHAFSFDGVFDDSTQQNTVYNESSSSLVSDFVAGRNCCILAYGQSKSGKTHTVLGPPAEDIDENDDKSIKTGISSLGSAGVSEAPQRAETLTKDEPPDQVFAPKPKTIAETSTHCESMGVEKPETRKELESEKRGIVPRVVHDIFDSFRKNMIKRRSLSSADSNKAEEPILRFSMVEISQDQTFDLLSEDRTPLKVKSDKECGSIVEHAVEKVCGRESEVLQFIHICLANRYYKDRSAEGISRSTIVIILRLERYSRSRGKRATSSFFIVDLADSELVRLASSDGASSQLIREAKAAKRSLGTLRKCLHALALKGRPPPSREDSILTKLLYASLGRGAGISVIVTASPQQRHVSETASALRFGVYVAGQMYLPPGGNKKGFDASVVSGQTDLLSRQSLQTDMVSRQSQYTDPSSYLNRSQRESFPLDNEIARELHEIDNKDSEDTKDTKDVIQSTDDQEQPTPVKKTTKSALNHPIPEHNQPTSNLKEIRREEAAENSSENSSKELDLDVEDKEGAAEIEEESADGDKQPLDLGETSAIDGENEPVDLEAVSSLLRSATEKIGNDLEVAKQELESGSNDIGNANTVEEMEADLELARKELENIVRDVDISSSTIDENINTLRGELGKFDLKPKDEIESRNNFTSPLSWFTKKSPEEIGEKHENLNGVDKMAQNGDAGSLTGELEALKRENEALRKAAERKDQDLAVARKEIDVLNLRLSEADKLDISRHTAGESSVYLNGFGNPNRPSLESLDEDDQWLKTESKGDTNVRVCLRLRPMTKIETSRRSRSCIEVHEGSKEFTVDSPLDGEYDFCYDHVFDTDATQESVYEVVGYPIIDDLFDGVNCCVIIYGLTGSGKVHTLMGKLPYEIERDEDHFEDESVTTNDLLSDEDAGITPRLIGDIFKCMENHPETVEFRISCSFVAIYLEKMYDLLEPQVGKTLFVNEDCNGVRIEGANEAYCFDESDVINLIHRSIACRSILGTRLNIDPKRSHTIFIINIEKKDLVTGSIQRSYLHLAKLAAFEVQSKGKGQSVQETKLVHKSFSALGNVIKSLTEGHAEAPYQESKLTCVLRDALGGNCKSTFIITASPSSYNISETTNTIRLGQRVRRIVNYPRANGDANVDHYRRWLLSTEVKMGELVGFVKELATKMVEDRNNRGEQDGPYDLSGELWKSIRAIADGEEIEENPCREALVFQDSEELRGGSQKWRALSRELAKRMPFEKLAEVMQARDRAESLLSDIQSELVVLRRQNELLVQDKRKKDAELAEAKRDNKLSALKNSELDHKLGIAENRAKEAITFLRYMRLLCWDLQTDIEKSRPVDILEITSCLSGAPDLSGLVDLDTLMIEAGFIKSRDSDATIEEEFIDYVADADAEKEESKQPEEHFMVEEDQLAGLDESIRRDRVPNSGWGQQNSRWTSGGSSGDRFGRTDRGIDTSTRTRNTSSGMDTSHRSMNERSILGLQVTLPWMQKAPNSVENEDQFVEIANSGYSRRERELQRDLHTLTNKCVELQVLLNTERQKIEALTNRTGSLHKKRLAQESIKLAQERDRMQHNAKAATWKLQELHVVNKVIAKQAASSKEQVTFLEEGFQRLQETFRTTVLDSLDADSQLRDRVERLQEMVDSLTGPGKESSEDEPDRDRERARLRLNIPFRGKMKPKIINEEHIDPSSEQSAVQCLMLTAVAKNFMKTPASNVRRVVKYLKRSRRTGTAYFGSKKEEMRRLARIAKQLVPPRFEGEINAYDASIYRVPYHQNSFRDSFVGGGQLTR